MSEDLQSPVFGVPTDERGEATGPLRPPRAEEPQPVEMNPSLPGIPNRFQPGMGQQWQREQEEAAQSQYQQVWRDTLDQSVVNSALQLFVDSPEAIRELTQSGRADLEQHREELTRDIPLHLHDNIMGSMTHAGAMARRERILNDLEVSGRLAQQTGLSRQAVMMAGGLLDADLPLIFASGGTLAAGRTALTTARAARALTGSTALARTTGDFAVGLSGGALSGAIVGGVGAMTRDDYDVGTMFQMMMAGAATGGALNPALGRVMPDRDVWAQAAQQEVSEAVRAAERDIHRQLADPDAAIHNTTSMTDDIDAGSTPVPRSVGAAEATPGGAADDIVEDTLGLANYAAPGSVIETSVRMQQWRQNSAFDERLAEDMENPIVRTLVGGSDATFRIPGTQTDVPIGRLAGRVFTIAQRDFTNLVHSRSPTANFVASEILESASGLGRNGSTSSVLREMYHASSMVHSAQALRDFRASYFRRNGLSPFRMDSQRQFSADLRLQMQRRYMGQDIDPEYKDVIDRIDRTHSEILHHMRGLDEDRSVRGAREIEDRPGYFRYSWEPERFRTFLRTEGSEEALTLAFKRGYMAASELDADTAEAVAKAVIRRFRNRGIGVDAADSRLLDLDSRSGIEQVLEEAKLPRAEIDRILERITANTQRRTQKGYLRARLEVDLSTPIPGTSRRLVDLMSDDFERTMHQYVGDAAGAAALAHKGIRDQADMNNLIDTILFEQQALNEDRMFTKPELEAILSQFSGAAHKGYLWGHETRGVSPMTSILGKVTRASLLQRTGLTQVMDTANLFVANGIANTMEPVMARLGWSGPNMKSKAELQGLHDELESILVVVGKDHHVFAPHLTIDERQVAEGVMVAGAQQAASSVERLTHYASGQIAVTAMQQRIAAAATTTNVLRTLAGQDTNLTNRMLRDIGIEGDTLHELTDLIENGVIKVDGSRIELNADQWSDELRLEFGASITRAVHQQAQRGLTGETSVWMNHDIGKLFTALKTFGLIATQKQMARNIMIGGAPHILQAAVVQLGFAYAVLSLAQAIQGTKMEPVDRARLAAAYTPAMGTIPMLADPMTSMLGFDDLNFSPYGRYNTFLSMPAADVLGRLSQSPGAIVDMVSGDGSYNDMQNARAMFFMNWYGMKQIWEAM
jgi:hypothetical protein